MRKIVSTIFIAVIGISFSFSKELEGKNLQAVKIVLEANQKRKSPAEPGTNLKTFPARNM